MSGQLGQVIAVASGKGGVGKTTIAVNTAVAMAARGARVGLVDADLYGPDAALMLGLTRRKDASHVEVWNRKQTVAPIERAGVKIMSAQFLMGEDQAFAAHTEFAKLLLRRLLHDVDWGELDYMVVDLPPGTADLQQGIVQESLAGIVLVVTPQDVAHLDARKLVTMVAESRIPIIGGVENMAGFVCPCCGECSPLFTPVGEKRSVWAHGVERLASIPFVSAHGTDPYQPAVVARPESPDAVAIVGLAETLMQRTAG